MDDSCLCSVRSEHEDGAAGLHPDGYSRKTRDYVKVLRVLKDLLPEAALETVLCDFEPAVWRAFQKIFPGVRGCLFHWTQAVWRKATDIGLRRAYLEDSRIRRFVRKLLSLPFLPHNQISDFFEKIDDRVPESGQLRRLVDYVHNQWIVNPMFAPRVWSVYGISTRTNNHVEGWNRRFNNLCRGLPLGVYRLIPALNAEARLLPVQNQLRSYTRKHSAKRQKEVFVAWGRHKKGEISTTELLTICSSFHGPIVR